MEITNEFKARVFAAYMPCVITIDGNRHYLIGVNWGERFLVLGELKEDGTPEFDSLPEYRGMSDADMIELTDLKDITNEDAIYISVNILGYPETYNQQHLIDNAIRFIVNLKGQLAWEIADFLRSKSYNLSFMGVDLVAAGIAIIKPNSAPADERSVATMPNI